MAVWKPRGKVRKSLRKVAGPMVWQVAIRWGTNLSPVNAATRNLGNAQAQANLQGNLQSLQGDQGILIAQSNNPINGGKASDIGQHDVQGYGPDGKTVFRAKVTLRVYNDGSGATRYYVNGKAMPTNIQTLEAAKVYARQQIGKFTLGPLPLGNPDAFGKTSSVGTGGNSVPTAQGRLQTLPGGTGQVAATVDGRVITTELKSRQEFKDGKWQAAGFVADGLTSYIDQPIAVNQKRESLGYFEKSMGKQRVVTGRDGAVINDLNQAKQRVLEMFKNGGLTMRDDATAQTSERVKESRRITPVEGTQVTQWNPEIPLPKPIAQMNGGDRLKYMAQVAWAKAGGNASKELQALTSWQSLALMGAFAGAQAVPGLNLVADAIAVLMLGKDVIDTGGKLADAIKVGLTATQPYELEKAGQQMGEALVHIAATAGTAAAGVGVKKVTKNYRDTASTRALESTLGRYKAGNASAAELRSAVIAASQDKAALAKAKVPTGTTPSKQVNEAPSQPPGSGSAAGGSGTPGTTGRTPATSPANAARTAEVAKAQSYLDGIGTPQVRAAVAEGANAIWQRGGKVDTAALNALKKAAEADFVKQTVPAVANAVFSEPALQSKLSAQLGKNAAGNPSKAQALASSPQAVQSIAQALVLPELQNAAFAGSKVPKAARDAFGQKAQTWAREQQPSNPAGALEALKGKPDWQATLINEVLVDQITGSTPASVKTLAKTDPAAAQVQNTLRQRIGAEVQQKYPNASSQKDLLAQAGGKARTDLVREQVASQLGGDSPMAAAVNQQLKAKGVGERQMVNLVNSPSARTNLLKTALIEQVRNASNPAEKLSPTQQIQLRKAIEKKLANIKSEPAKQQYLKDLANSGQTIGQMTRGEANIPSASSAPSSTPPAPRAPANPTGTAASAPTQTVRPLPSPSEVVGGAAPGRGGAIVLAKPAAVAFDIPVAPGAKGETRVGAVYGNVAATQATGIGDNLANVLGRTLQQVNPASYGKRTLPDVIANNVRGDPDTSLTVVVRDKNIQGQSPSSDSVATKVTQAGAGEYDYGQIAGIVKPDALARATNRIRLGSAKIYEAPPARDAGHVNALQGTRKVNAEGVQTSAQRGGQGYGYVGQVVGTNLRGSGYQAMVEVQNLAKAANMKGLTLYTNAEAGFYQNKLGFQNVAETPLAGGGKSTHMVWENPNYTPDKPTLKLNNPAVVNALKDPPPSWGGRPPTPPATPSGNGGGTSPTPGTGGTGSSGRASPPVTNPDGSPRVNQPTQAQVGTPSRTGGVAPGSLTTKDMGVSFNGLRTSVALDTLRAKAGKVKSDIYDKVSVAYEAKVEGPVLDFASKLGSGINNRIVAPSARALNDKILTPAMDSALGQKLTSVVDRGAAQFKEAAFQTKLQYVYHSNSELGLVLKDMATIAKNAGQGTATGTFKALSNTGKTLQKTLPAVAASTALVLTNAAANGKLRVVTVEGGITPTGEALMVKKALNIPNGLKFTYLIADTPGMENVGGRAIFAFGGGGSAVVTPATGPGQSGVSQPWIGKRADGSIVTTATGAAYGPNAFVGFNQGTTNFNISDVYAGQLGRASTNPVSASAGGVRPSGRGADLKLGVIAADLLTFNHSSVLNVGPAALTFGRHRDPLSLKGTLGSTENKFLVLMPKTKPNGEIYYTPFLDPTLKGGVSQIEPVVPLTGSTTFDPNAKDIAALGSLLNRVGSMLPKSDPSNTPQPSPQPAQPYLPGKRRSDLHD